VVDPIVALVVMGWSVYCFLTNDVSIQAILSIGGAVWKLLWSIASMFLSSGFELDAVDAELGGI
jgi:hypothetical protein